MTLAVKTKLHLDRPRDKGFDWQALFDHYNQFPFLPQYSAIKPKHFHRKNLNPWHKPGTSKVALGPEKLVFGTLDNEVDMKDMSKDERGDDDNNANANANANANDYDNDNVVPRQRQNYGKGQCNKVESANGEKK